MSVATSLVAAVRLPLSWSSGRRTQGRPSCRGTFGPSCSPPRRCPATTARAGPFPDSRRALRAIASLRSPPMRAPRSSGTRTTARFLQDANACSLAGPASSARLALMRRLLPVTSSRSQPRQVQALDGRHRRALADCRCLCINR